MPASKNKPHIYTFVLVPVTLLILGALGLSVASILENMRFSKATAQVLWFSGVVRSFVSQQGTSFLTPGENVWTSMVSAGQIPETTEQINAWNGRFRAIAQTNATLRIETEVPPPTCRRMVWHFIGMPPQSVNILSIAARETPSMPWSVLYPTDPEERATRIKSSCGNKGLSHLAFVFRIQ